MSTQRAPGFGAAYALGKPIRAYTQRHTIARPRRAATQLAPQEATVPEHDEAGPDLAPPPRGYATPAQEAASDAPCPNCGDGGAARAGYVPPTFVYAIGRVEAHFPSLGVEKEFAQAGSRAGAGGNNAAFMRQALEANRYLIRQMCWVFRISGMETYLLRPRDPADYNLLWEALRDGPAPTDMDVVIGLLYPQPTSCGVLSLPVIAFDQLYSFDRASLLGALPRPEAGQGRKADAAEDAAWNQTSAEVLDRIALMTDNAGATDEHRALNYLAVRYDGIYQQTAAAHGANRSLAHIDVQPAPVSSTRNMVDVILTYTDRTTDVPDRWFVRVDVEEEFPFLVTRLAPYFSR